MFIVIVAVMICTSIAHANGNTIAEIFREAFPKIKADKIEKAQIAGLYEIQSGQNIFYFDPHTKHLIFGDIVARDGRNISADRREHLLSGLVREIPLEKAIRIGRGKNIVIEFTDPDCPFCRRVAEWFTRKSAEDVSRYIFFYPISKLHPNAGAKAKYILSANDRVKAYEEVMKGTLDSINPTQIASTKEGASLLAEHKSIASKIGVMATPTFWINGKHVSGADLPLIDKYLKGDK